MIVGRCDGADRACDMPGEARAAGSVRVVRVPVDGLRLDRSEALRYLGYAGQELDEALRKRFDDAVVACERDLRPACIYAIFDVDETQTCWPADDVDDTARVDGSTVADSGESGTPCVALAGTSLVLPGRNIALHVHRARKVALMTCTLGAASERELRKHAALGATDGLLYGAAASALVEAAANATEAALVAEAATQGFRLSSRFSPGYGDLPLSVQPALLTALDATRRIGVVATESNMLVPSKSVTAVAGLFDRFDLAQPERALCDTCRLRNSCLLRKKGTTCHG